MPGGNFTQTETRLSNQIMFRPIICRRTRLPLATILCRL
ncbi:hypothetical protein Leryth_005921 [Lithospermum erythrorhizon]|nr:hypothetical protein Leryth_005921 [Lithospermum erythrorhizon]